MSFNYDLSRGKKVEYQVAKYMKTEQGWGNVRVAKGLEKRWDITSNGGNVEVKYDPMSEKTGNFVIETEFGGQPSGIRTSEADFWVFVDKTHMYWITLDILLDLVRSHRCLERTFVGRGDKKSKKALLMPTGKVRYSPFVRAIKL